VPIDWLTKLQDNMPPLTRLLGIELLAVAPEQIDARMTAREDLGNGSGILHGGAYMAFADYLGAIGTVVNLAKGTTTTTLESKTNFFAPAVIGTVVLGRSTPLHRGRRTMVWQTRLTNDSGRLLALVTQTQMVLEATKSG
jgi:1,4-dihydroxy-2-naphthoyl-CoA hydrolase